VSAGPPQIGRGSDPGTPTAAGVTGGPPGPPKSADVPCSLADGRFAAADFCRMHCSVWGSYHFQRATVFDDYTVRVETVGVSRQNFFR